MIIFWVLVTFMTLVATGFAALPFCFEKQNYVLTLSIIILFPILALGFYIETGSSAELAKYFAMERVMSEMKQAGGEVLLKNKVFSALKERVQAFPNDAKAWYLLGRLYLSDSQFSSAANAFEKANISDPDNINILLYDAETLYLVHHTLEGRPIQLLQHLLKLDPQNAVALNLLAMEAYNKKQYKIAVQYWEQILPQYSPASQEGLAIRQAIARAQKIIQNQ